MTPNTIQFYSDSHTEVLHLSKEGIWANPDIPADEAAKLVLEAIDHNIKVLVEKAVADEREACAELCVKLAVGGGFAADCATAIRARGENT